ncbi:phosphatidate cytidylyltransferase [Psychromarinibacter halotolerans]|uniref:Phosphatidate cytidylyltransferase n=1 Tax=Psychromarinibacter halotolerans TaxID=1775175 RepID=A0ABV7GVX3_9RHOB|nr:phosphatidate cytidylyltransferase [Psychromarinibacter halotolerans]MDF0594747.1 phosphatidate cytidylyltransferase [Psychromarinibacter halotolerans]
MVGVAYAGALPMMLALLCLALLAVGYVVVLGLMAIPATRATARDVFPVLLTETLIVGVVAGAFLLGTYAIVALFAVLALRCGYEAARITLPRAGIPGALPAMIAGAVMLVLGLLASRVHPIPLALGAVLLMGVLLALRPMLRRDGPAKALADLVLFPGVPLILFTGSALQGGAATMLVAFLLVETFDSYALLGGKLFGKRKAFPVLSPKKTVEGLASGAVMLMLTVGLLGPLLGGFPVLGSMLFALAAGALTVAGDLAASRLKRVAGVKDYPAVLPHQGGLLDITDAWIATGAGLVTLMSLGNLF